MNLHLRTLKPMVTLGHQLKYIMLIPNHLDNADIVLDKAQQMQATYEWVINQVTNYARTHAIKILHVLVTIMKQIRLIAIIGREVPLQV